MMKISEDKSVTWKKILDDFTLSNQTVIAYCEEHSLNVATFYYWKKKFKQQVITEPEFIQIAAAEPFTLPLHSSAPVIIHMGSIEIAIADHCHPELLENLLGVLSKYA